MNPSPNFHLRSCTSQVISKTIIVSIQRHFNILCKSSKSENHDYPYKLLALWKIESEKGKKIMDANFVVLASKEASTWTAKSLVRCPLGQAYGTFARLRFFNVFTRICLPTFTFRTRENLLLYLIYNKTNAWKALRPKPMLENL